MDNLKEGYEAISERLLSHIARGPFNMETEVRIVEHMVLLRATKMPVAFAHQLANKLDQSADKLRRRSNRLNLGLIAGETILDLRQRVDPAIESRVDEQSKSSTSTDLTDV